MKINKEAQELAYRILVEFVSTVEKNSPEGIIDSDVVSVALVGAQLGLVLCIFQAMASAEVEKEAALEAMRRSARLGEEYLEIMYNTPGRPRLH